RPGKSRKVDPERRIGDALRQQRQHDEAGHDERAVADPLHLGDPRADRRAKHDEIQRSRDYRGDDALQQGPSGTRHFKTVNCPHGVHVHGRSLTKVTKMSSSELCVVWRSLNLIPAASRSFSNAMIPARSPRVSYV